MKISLIDVDSKIPNLALMKISTYHKQRGDIVGFNLSNPDKIYASIIFNKNNGVSKNKQIQPIQIEYGGSGYDLSVKLPGHIEKLKPDYDLYPSTYSQGFTSRGCNRDCYFCLVTKKEGRFQITQHPLEFYDDRFKEIMLMDNNILLDKLWTKEVLSWCIEEGLKVNMTQGYDIRLLDKPIADLILQCRNDVVRFAFDDSKLECIIREKIKLLKDAGFNLKNNVAFYCYCNDDSMYEDTLYRCNILKNLGTNAHVMFNCDMPKTERIRSLMKWSWRKQLYWSIPFSEYSRLKHT